MVDVMAQRFTEDLRGSAAHIWQRQHDHPFVRGIGEGSLPLEKFTFWVRQDYLFLIEYARLLALATARSPEWDTLRRFSRLLTATVDEEMSLHCRCAQRLGIGVEKLQRESKAPTTQGYTDFLVRVAATGDFAELVSALLPCMWGYSELGQRLAKGPRPRRPEYAEWIDMYASSGFAELAEWCCGLLDCLAAGVSSFQRDRLQAVFFTSSRYELRFWDMAWNMESWPL